MKKRYTKKTYAYFTENFNEIEKALAVDKTVYTHKETFNTEDCVEGIISYVEKLYTEKPGSRLELQIPVGPNQTVIVEKRTVVEDLEEEKTNIKGVINDERNAHELKFINNWFHVTNK